MGARFTVLPRGGSPRSVQYIIRLARSTSRSMGSGRLSTRSSISLRFAGLSPFGISRSVLAVAGKSGIVTGIDRANKTVIFKTPGTTISNTERVDETLKLVCPGAVGGAEWNGTAYHPGLGILYTGMVDWCFYYSTKDYSGEPGFWVGRKVSGESPTVRPDFSKPARGWISAMDGETGKGPLEVRGRRSGGGRSDPHQGWHPLRGRCARQSSRSGRKKRSGTKTNRRQGSAQSRADQLCRRRYPIRGCSRRWAGVQRQGDQWSPPSERLQFDGQRHAQDRQIGAGADYSYTGDRSSRESAGILEFLRSLPQPYR